MGNFVSTMNVVSPVGSGKAIFSLFVCSNIFEINPAMCGLDHHFFGCYLDQPNECQGQYINEIASTGTSMVLRINGLVHPYKGRLDTSRK